MDAKTLDKFNSKIDFGDNSDSCWVWKGLTRGSYGIIKVQGVNKSAHRLSFEHHNGPIPEGLFVCHHCDNRLCVNPKHLWLGNNSDNMKDMYSKGRNVKHNGTFQKGSSHRSAILNEEKVVEMRELYSTGLVDYSDLAKHYGIAEWTARKVVERISWKHVA